MIKNYIKTAWRNLLRQKAYTAINIIGLAVGIAAFLLIFLVVQFETSFDDFHKKKDRIYRVVTAYSNPDGIKLKSGTPLPVSEGLRIDFPQLKEVSAILKNSDSHFSIESDGKGQPEKKFKDDAYYAEPQFFNIFDFVWLSGDKKTALSEPYSVVLAQSEAEKFFGTWQDAVGKILRYENKTDLKVTGILTDPPANTDFPLKLIISYATIKVRGSGYYGNINDWVSTYGDNFCFVVLPENMSVSSFNSSLKTFVKKHKPAEYAKDGFELQPLTEMHYNTDIGLFSAQAFSKQLIKAISMVGLFLLVIACVNFINLATAQAVNRSKEVGIRKVLGSNRVQLMLQFICETFIITLFAILFAIVLAEIMLPVLNNLLQIKLDAAFFTEPLVWLFLSGVVISVTLISGFYPALVISGFNPITALKNKIAARRSSGGISIRRALVVLQFCVAQVLVIGTLVIVYQMDYFRNKSLGFDKEAIITVPFPTDSVSKSKLNALRDQLLQQQGIADVSYSFGSPSDDNRWGSDFKYNNSGKQTNFEADLKWADAEYFKLYKLQFVAGQPYAKGDTVHGWVVNQALLARLGIREPKQAIGKYIQLWDSKTKYAPIVGVVKDFNISSLKNAIEPVIMGSWKNVYQKINIKLQPTNISQTLASVEKLWSNTFPDGMYEYQFLDEKIANFYKTEDQLSKLYKLFAGIAIFISCLGLYGLMSFMTIQRIKEVGVRKTLGASVASIVYLFSREFTLLVIIAFAISVPTGYYFMYKWLQNFTYRIPLGPGIFILTLVVSIAIAWITVGYKSIKAALANPVKSLRSE